MKKTFKNTNEMGSGLKNWFFAAILTISIYCGMNQVSKAQIPEVAFEYIANPFVQPNDSTLNWYGSGDVNNDTLVDWDDIIRFDELIKESFIDPNDRRLSDRADVNGDSVVNFLDRQILHEYLNGTRPYLPGQWNELKTRAEREEWLQKMINIDNPRNTCNNIPDSIMCNCVDFSEQMMINFHGANSKELQEFLYVSPYYDTIDNGRFNLPLFILSLHYYNTNDSVLVNGKYYLRELAGHACNTIMLGDSPLNWYDFGKIEPQGNAIIEIGEWYLRCNEFVNRISVGIQGFPPNKEGNSPDFNAWMLFSGYFGYEINDNQITNPGYYCFGEQPWSNQCYPSILQRDSSKPEINIISPSEKVLYSKSPKLISATYDETIFDKYAWKNGIRDNCSCDTIVNDTCVGWQCIYGEKIYYNPYIALNLDSQKIYNTQIFKNTNRSLEEIMEEELDEGEHQLVIHAKDAFGNESSETRNFAIDKTNPEIFVYSPKKDSTYTEKYIVFNYKIVDHNLDTKIENTHYKFNGITGYFSNYSEGTIPLTSREGENKLEITTKDLAGNQGNKTIIYTYSPKTRIEYNVSKVVVIVSPNPVREILRFEFVNNFGEEMEIELYNSAGQLIGENKTNKDNFDYDISNHARGFYIYRIKDSSGNIIDSGEISKK